jgi:uncharacterized spore protein YtfJ
MVQQDLRDAIDVDGRLLLLVIKDGLGWVSGVSGGRNRRDYASVVEHGSGNPSEQHKAVIDYQPLHYPKPMK